MSKRPTFTDAPLSPDIPSDAVKQEFARRLQRAMVKKGWTQSELARQAARFAPNKQMIRDNISKYIRAKVLPGPLHLAALCKALGMEPDELLPTRGMPSAGGHDRPPFDMRFLEDGNAWLRINMAVPQSVALKIAELLQSGKG